MRYIDLFVRDHPELDVERAVLENCPSDFGYRDKYPECVAATTDEAACRRCWEREAED